MPKVVLAAPLVRHVPGSPPGERSWTVAGTTDSSGAEGGYTVSWSSSYSVYVKSIELASCI